MRVTPRATARGWPFFYNNTNTTTPTERSAHMATDQVSFYDESLKKQIEGSFISDGKSIASSSASYIPDLIRLERYERRAWSRQKRAIQEFVLMKFARAMAGLVMA
jgi:hypothetical protein